jgi:MFS family permease
VKAYREDDRVDKGNRLKDGKATGAAWIALGILLFMYMVSYLDRSILSLLVEPIKHDLHVSDLQMGLVMGLAFALFYGLVGIPMGWLADRYSRRGIIFVGMVIWSLACAGCGLAGSFIQLLIGRFALGAGEATLTPAGNAVIGDGFPNNRMSLAINIFKMGALLGGTLSAGIGGLLIAWANARGPVSLPIAGALHPWQLVLIMVGAPGLVAAFLAFLLPSRRSAPVGGKPKAPLGPFLARRKLYAASVLGGGALLAIPSFAGQAWGATFLIRHYHLPIQQVGAVLGITALAPALGFLFHGWLADKMFARGIKAAHFWPGIWTPPLLMTTTVLCYVVIHDIRILVPMLFINGFLLTCLTPLDGHVQVCSPSAYRGRTSALYGANQHLIAVSVGPALVALFTEKVFHDPAKIGYGLAATICLSAPLGMLVLFLGRKAAARAADQVLEDEAGFAALPMGDGFIIDAPVTP